jgi:hypothetical protein
LIFDYLICLLLKQLFGVEIIRAKLQVFEDIDFHLFCHSKCCGAPKSDVLLKETTWNTILEKLT